MLYNNILETVGQTPIISLDRLAKKHGIEGKLFAKIEYFNPSLSKKDRVAKFMIEELERTGQLKPGQTVIEATSGNTGIAVATACAVKGYPFVAVMSAGNSKERVVRLEWLGAKVELVPQAQGAKQGQVSHDDYLLVEKRFLELLDELKAVPVGQFVSENNPETHYLFTATEILKDIPSLDAFCDFLGTNGTFAGISRRFKEEKPNIKCIAIEPENKRHIIQGGGYFKEEFLNSEHIDEKIIVSDDDAIFWTKELATCEGITGGISSGANLAAAIKYLKANKNKSILFLVNDNFVNYMTKN